MTMTPGGRLSWIGKRACATRHFYAPPLLLSSAEDDPLDPRPQCWISSRPQSTASVRRPAPSDSFPGS